MIPNCATYTIRTYRFSLYYYTLIVLIQAYSGLRLKSPLFSSPFSLFLSHLASSIVNLAPPHTLPACATECSPTSCCRTSPAVATPLHANNADKTCAVHLALHPATHYQTYLPPCLPACLPAWPGMLQEVQFASGLWVGLELEEPRGKNNGTIKGVK